MHSASSAPQPPARIKRLSTNDGSKPAKAPKHETVMDVTEERLAHVYAKAFLGVAARLPNADGLVEELVSVVEDVLNRFPKLELTLDSSLVSQEQKEQVLDRVFSGRASREVLNFSRCCRGMAG